MPFHQAFDIGRSLRAGWALLLRAPAPLLVGGVLLLFLDGNPGGVGMQWPTDGSDLDEWWPLIVAIAGFACAVGIVFFLASSWIEVGYANAVEEAARTGDVGVAAVFDAKGRWVAMMLTRVLVGIAMVGTILPLIGVVGLAVFLHEGLDAPEGVAVLVGVVSCLAYAPVIVYVALGLALARLAVALEGLDPFSAFKRSWSLVSGNRLWLLLFAIVLGFVEILGLVACCVGVLWTATWVRVAWIESYLALTRPEAHAAYWVTSGRARDGA